MSAKNASAHRSDRVCEIDGTTAITGGRLDQRKDTLEDGRGHSTEHRETADDYRGELFRLGSYRVAVCADGLQWLYQRRDPSKAAAGARWRTLGFCRTRAALERLQRENSQPPAPEIEALPERLKRQQRQP